MKKSENARNLRANSRQIIRISLKNWRKYHSRSDVKKPTWFKMSAKVLQDPLIFALNAEEFRAFVFLLSGACEAQSETFIISISQAKSSAKVKKSALLSMLSFLSEHQRVTYEFVNEPVTSTLRARTGNSRQNKKEKEKENKRENEIRLESDVLEVENESRPAEPVSPVARVWSAYAAAYEKRYHSPATWNAKVAGQLKHFVRRVPIDEAPNIAAFFIEHNGSRYVAGGHAVGLLLQDAEKLRTEFLTGRKITSVDVKNADLGDSIRSQLSRLTVVNHDAR